MERVPREDYVERHRPVLTRLLDGAEALALYHEPGVRLRGGSADAPEVMQVEGIVLDAYDPETEVGKRAAAEINMASVDLQGFRTMVTASLTMEYLDHHPEQYGYLSPSQLRQSTFEISREILLAVCAASADYARSDFLDADSGNGFIVRTMQIHRPNGSVLARELVLTVTDGLVDRALTVVEMDDSLEVRQDIDPTENDVIRAMVEFFVDKHGDEDSVQAIMASYWTQALGGQAMDLAAVYSRYTAAGDRATIDGFTAQLRAQVDAVREGLQLEQAAPELLLPSAEELAAYVELIAAAGG